MTLAKRLLLGTAAALVATSGAHAADLGLPVAPSVDYVQICSIGSFTGFILPGGDVCFDISGYARGQYTWTEESDGLDYNTGTYTAATTPALNTAQYVTYAAGIITVESAANLGAPTDQFGFAADATVDITGLTLDAAGDNDESDFLGNGRLNFDARTMTEYGLLRGFIRLDGENSGPANVDRAFVQLNVGSLGFTAGLADSVFDPVFTGYGAGVAGLYVADQASVQFSVNAAVGNGVTFSASVEDDDARASGLAQITVDVAAAPTAYVIADLAADGGQSIPDLVAALRVDQAWGSAKLAAALHEVNPAGSIVGSEFGYAISASAEFNIPVGVGSTFGITGIYANGAQNFMGFDTQVGTAATAFVDGIVTTDTATGTSTLDLTTSYVIAAGFNFGVSSMLALHLDGAYADVDHEGSLFDASLYTVRGGVTYTPINNLSIAATVAYTAADFQSSGLFASGVDDDEWAARFRVTRSF